MTSLKLINEHKLLNNMLTDKRTRFY